MAGEDNFVYMQATSGREFPVGKTHRYYRFAPATDDLSITIPLGARYFAILDPVEELVYETNIVARGGIELLDSRRKIVADDEEPLRPISPGEFINISHSDGATGIGVFTLILEGGLAMPIGASNLVAVDPAP